MAYWCDKADFLTMALGRLTYFFWVFAERSRSHNLIEASAPPDIRLSQLDSPLTFRGIGHCPLTIVPQTDQSQCNSPRRNARLAHLQVHCAGLE